MQPEKTTALIECHLQLFDLHNKLLYLIIKVLSMSIKFFIGNSFILFLISCQYVFASNWYIGIDTGITKYKNPSSYNIGSESLNGCENDSNDILNCPVDKTDKSNQVKIGYKIKNKFNLEIGYTNLGETLNSSIFNADGRFITTKQDSKLASISFIATKPLKKLLQTELYSKFGFGYWSSKIKFSSSFPELSGSKKDNGYTPIIGFGIRYNFSKKVSIGTGIDYYFSTGKKDNSLDEEAKNLNDLFQTTDASVGVMNIGVVYKF
jgi:opacity protein-like surface antigen